MIDSPQTRPNSQPETPSHPDAQARQTTHQTLTPPVQVPADGLSASALREVIENYVLREGTDYGRAEISLDHKVEQLMKQIRSGGTKIVFDPVSESVTLMTENEWKKLSHTLETSR